MAERRAPNAADNDHLNQATSLAAAMGASLRRYWDERTGYQTFLYGAGVLLLASVLALAGPFAVTMWALARRWRGAPPPTAAPAAG